MSTLKNKEALVFFNIHTHTCLHAIIIIIVGVRARDNVRVRVRGAPTISCDFNHALEQLISA